MIVHVTAIKTAIYTYVTVLHINCVHAELGASCSLNFSRVFVHKPLLLFSYTDIGHNTTVVNKIGNTE